MDREAKAPLELLEDIEDVLGIETYAMNWPIGSGKGFKGVYSRKDEEILAFEPVLRGQKKVEATRVKLGGDGLDSLIGSEAHAALREDISLLDVAGTEFDRDALLHGRQTPVFFGSALTNFGVEPFLEAFLRLTPPPLPRNSSIGPVDSLSDTFSAFVFKIQANMNPAHRDRIAFLRICSGVYQRGMEVLHVQQQKQIKLAQAQQMMAEERKNVEEAYAGDIIGVFDPGIFSIGDTLLCGGERFTFEGIPTFAPEHFARVAQTDTMKRKQFVKGIAQIAQEGAIQVFKEPGGGMEEVIVGAVGVLQFEVLEYRLENEYNVAVRLQKLPYQHIRWIVEMPAGKQKLDLTSDTKRVEDLKGNPLLLFANQWNVTWAEEHNKGLKLAEVGRG